MRKNERENERENESKGEGIPVYFFIHKSLKSNLTQKRPREDP